jgi:hypothetical protein
MARAENFMLLIKNTYLNQNCDLQKFVTVLAEYRQPDESNRTAVVEVIANENYMGLASDFHIVRTSLQTRSPRL